MAGGIGCDISEIYNWEKFKSHPLQYSRQEELELDAIRKIDSLKCASL